MINSKLFQGVALRGGGGAISDKPSQALKLRPTENLKKDIDIWLNCQQMEI